MTMLDATLTAQLSAHLERLQTPIELIASLDDSAKSAETAELLGEIEALSPKITYRRDGIAARRPSFLIQRVGTDIAVEFAGVPLGHEFTSLVLALLHVGGHAPRVSDTEAEQIRSLAGPLHFETFFSLSCQNCPDVVQSLNILSVLNPNVSHTAIDGSSFTAEAEARGVLAVPTVFLNGEVWASGRMTIEEIIAKLDTNAEARDAAALAAKDPFDVLVVGGGPAGASAAVYAARKGIRTGLVAERFGGQVQDTMGIENLISITYTEGPKLSAAMEAHVGEYEVDVMKRQRAARLLAPGDDGLVGIELANGAVLHSRTVVLSPGARWRTMGVPGEEEYRNKGVTFCPHCDGPLFKGKRVAVIGGGNSGVEAAIDLAGIVSHVTVLEFMPEMRADAVLQNKLRSLPNVDVVLSAASTEVRGDGSKVTGLVWKDRTTDAETELPVDGIFVQIGLLPSTDWLKDSGIELSPRGEIVIDDRGATSMPGVFAAGDATTTPYKQIIISMGAGATASLSAFDHLIRHSAPAPALASV